MTDDAPDRLTPDAEAHYFSQRLQDSLKAHQEAFFETAESGYREVLRRFPKHTATLELYGALLHQLGRLDEAERQLCLATELDKTLSSAWNRLGAVRLDLGRTKDALHAFVTATNADADNIEAWLNRSRVAESSGNLTEAITAARHVNQRFPEVPTTQARLGAALLAAGEYDSAIHPLKQAVRRDPLSVEPYLHLALAFQRLSHPVRAQATLRRAILLAPSQPSLYPHLTSEAGEAFPTIDETLWASRAILINPLNSGLWARLAALYESQKVDDAAAEAAKRALLLNPQDQAAHLCLGLPLFRLEQFSEADSATRHALLLLPDTTELYFVAAACAFIFGDAAAGWPLYERRVGSRIDTERVGLPALWDGKSDPGHLLVAAEQGVGDEYIFLSRLSCLRGRTRKITVECDKRNIELFERSFPGMRFIERQIIGREEASPYFDYRNASETLRFDRAILAGSLLAMFMGDCDLAGPSSFLRPDQDEAERWRAHFRHMTSRPIIGVCWRGGTSTAYRESLYCDAEMMLRALGPHRAFYVNLVYNPREGESRIARERLGCDLHDLTGIDQKDELDRVAAMISVMDAVVSVDTAVCPLAAAVGTPTIRLGRSLMFQSDGHDAVLGSCYPMTLRDEPFDMKVCLRRASECLSDILKDKP